MKVYIVPNSKYYLDGYQGELNAEKVFDTQRKALDYVITQYYNTPFYQNMSQRMLDSNASEYVHEFEVE